jgi:hypothetical protein
VSEKICAQCGSKFRRRPKESHAQFAAKRFCRQSCSGAFNIRVADGGWNSGRHFATGTPTYRTWQSMRARCERPGLRLYPRYGGRGIVCERWKRFDEFLEDMGASPSLGHTIERIDNDGPYAPGNCRWATRTEQSRNTSQNVFVEWQGARRCVAEWAEITGIPKHTIAYRVRQGWPTERVFSPVRGAATR